MEQAIIWTHAELIHWRINVALWGDGLKSNYYNSFEDRAPVDFIDKWVVSWTYDSGYQDSNSSNSRQAICSNALKSFISWYQNFTNCLE